MRVTRAKTFLVVAIIVLIVPVSACKRGSPFDTKAIHGWAEGEGYQWIEGPDEIQTEQAFFD